LHPAGRSFAGTAEIHGLVDPPGRHRATVRLSKGVGTRGDRADIRGLAVRMHLPGRDFDLLLSTAGRGRLTRHLPMPRRTFDAYYGTITAYRTGAGKKVYLEAHPDPDAAALGGALETVADSGHVVLEVRHDGLRIPAGRVSWDRALPADVDAELAFDPVRNALPGLHPTGLVHSVRAYAYRLSQRWRGVIPAPQSGAALAPHLPAREH
jgi:hypothetical protein